MNRVYNFAAGPSSLPQSVLEKIQKELLNFNNCGCSVMEMSHRSKEYEEVIFQAKRNLIDLLNVPDDYEILFLQGGASLQFSMIPMNLANRNDTVAYALTGQFATKAYEEAKRWCNAEVVSSSKDSNFTYIPKDLKQIKNAKYLHITGNNTIYGTSYNTKIDYGNIPIVCDYSSAILGKEINIKDYALIYAGAQKNMGIAGVTVVILKKELIKNDLDPIIPTMLRYDIHSKNDSMYNTPNTFGIYVLKLVTDWVKESGGVKELEKNNQLKAKLLYDYLDHSSLFYNPVNKIDRSIMNVIFTLNKEELTDKFINYCKENSIINIKGHRSVGGCRASIYNAVSIEAVKYLINIMDKFEKENK